MNYKYQLVFSPAQRLAALDRLWHDNKGKLHFDRVCKPKELTCNEMGEAILIDALTAYGFDLQKIRAFGAPELKRLTETIFPSDDPIVVCKVNQYVFNIITSKEPEGFND